MLEAMRYYIEAVEDALAFMQSVGQPEGNVDVRMNCELFHLFSHIITCCAECVYCIVGGSVLL